ncbi:integrase arm-type DNA-binding domain-containing protein [Brachymonas sp. G13]|uniref:tyrosine-type recombinase/integrase n=1 Tax=Brachymonas wangyanguii TaxID=3130163 RepID=UPI00307E7BF1
MHAVGGVPGLYLYVSDAGARSWIVRVTVHGKRREMGLGGFDDVTLAQAREKARQARQQAIEGIDPVQERKAARLRRKTETVPTFKKCAIAYIDAHAAEWRNAKHAAQWASTLETYAYPLIGEMSVADIETRHVLEVLRPIWTTKTETAARLRGRIEQILSAATVPGYRKGDNPARWRGHLDHLLPKPSKIAKVQHHAAMPIDETPQFMVTLAGITGISAKALEFAILTAARSGEVRGATWDEIDLDGKVWTIPAERMKAGKEHRVPLSIQAIELLKALPIFVGVPYVFGAPRGGQLSDMAMTAVMRRQQLPYVPHGFRSTFRDWCSERTHCPSDLAEMALAHAIKSEVEAAYRRGDMLDKRRELMQTWADFVRPRGAT